HAQSDPAAVHRADEADRRRCDDIRLHLRASRDAADAGSAADGRASSPQYSGDRRREARRHHCARRHTQGAGGNRDGLSRRAPASTLIPRTVCVGLGRAMALRAAVARSARPIVWIAQFIWTREQVLILINEHIVAAWLLARVSFQRESA